MKVCIISFDYWNYDRHIVKTLQKRGIEAFHINMGKYHYRNFGERAYNAFSKVFFGRNIKHIRRQDYVLESLKNIGFQDTILVLNPHTLDYTTIATIKNYTHHLVTYLYDNLERFPVEDKLELFDKVYSFEDKDVERYGFKKITNYNYLSDIPAEQNNCQRDLYYITSYDKRRNKLLRELAYKLANKQIDSKIVIVGKQVWKEKLRNFFSNRLPSNIIELRNTTVGSNEVLQEYQRSKVIVDLMREGQEGLSFRIFEAMAMEKKIITDNANIRNYDFYDPRNILILEKDFNNLDQSFFDTPYYKLPHKIYARYTLNKWVETIFNLHDYKACQIKFQNVLENKNHMHYRLSDEQQGSQNTLPITWELS